MHSLTRLSSLLALILFCLQPAAARTIAMIGTGDVGSALGVALAEHGHTIVYGSRNPDRDSVRELVARTGGEASAGTQADAAQQADIIVLAIPPHVVEDTVRGLGELDGKIIVDPTNPMRLVAGRFERTTELSNTELIQAAAPDAQVVKAFSTVTWQTMLDPDTSAGPISVPLAGNDENAKTQVAELVTQLGLEPIDLGDARDARWIEGMLLLWINNRFSERPAFEFHLRRIE
ncbi:MAG: NADPH-dependent F420 reductase [Pseudomonadota bacterium]